MVEDEGAAWRERRRAAVSAHAAADERRRATEIEQARRLVAEFTAQARDRGLRPTRLTAVAYNGRSRYRTRLTGWYVDVARSRAVDETGTFYVLSVPSSLRARLLGARPQPQPPRLIVGEGGPDGHSMPLETMLRKRLAAGDDWP